MRFLMPSQGENSFRLLSEAFSFPNAVEEEKEGFQKPFDKKYHTFLLGYDDFTILNPIEEAKMRRKIKTKLVKD